MSPSPWRPPGLEQAAVLGIRFDTVDGTLQEESIEWTPSHRVIASEYAGENLFDRLTGDVDYQHLEDEIDALREIADLTNLHVQHEAGRFDLVRAEDRVYGYGSGLIMAAFAFPGPPSRFSDGEVGVFYAASTLDVAITETRYHDEQTLRGSAPCIVEKTAIQTNLNGTLVDIRRGRAHPGGVYEMDDYGRSQAFGSMVRRLEGYGIVYDSVRHRGGECVAVFRPPVLSGATAVQTLEYIWDGARISRVR